MHDDDNDNNNISDYFNPCICVWGTMVFKHIMMGVPGSFLLTESTDPVIVYRT